MLSWFLFALPELSYPMLHYSSKWFSPTCMQKLYSGWYALRSMCFQTFLLPCANQKCWWIPPSPTSLNIKIPRLQHIGEASVEYISHLKPAVVYMSQRCKGAWQAFVGSILPFSLPTFLPIFYIQFQKIHQNVMADLNEVCTIQANQAKKMYF